MSHSTSKRHPDFKLKARVEGIASPIPKSKEALLQISTCAPVNHIIISAKITTPQNREKIWALESRIEQLQSSNMDYIVENGEMTHAVDYYLENMAAAVETNKKLLEKLKEIEQHESDLVAENKHLKRQVNRLQAKMTSMVENNKAAVGELMKVRDNMKWANEQAKAMMEDTE
ncbi:hypothetical protein BKA80DRAFT_346864 [Phyllosticta citrichinensis]